MKTFNDIVFRVDGAGKRSYTEFNNGYGISVIQGPYSYGGPEGLFEIAVTKDNDLCMTSSVTDDVVGWLGEEEVTSYMKQIQEL